MKNNLLMLCKIFIALHLSNCFAKRIQRNSFTPIEMESEIFLRTTRSRERINISVPGTRWCGPGNTASDYNDLGSQADVDMCCRDHDHCDNIPAGETKYNLTNDDYFTILHCDCDKEFYKCLYDIDTRKSNQIGQLYFMLRNRCYRNDYPIVKCSKYDTKIFVHRCIEYVTDQSKSMRYQYFDLPIYYAKNSHDQIEYDFDNDA